MSYSSKIVKYKLKINKKKLLQGSTNALHTQLLPKMSESFLKNTAKIT